MSAPVVAIIGRPNVGKSTLFNRVIGERRAVTHDRPGVTRDRNAVRTEWLTRPFVLVDTGGFLPASSEGRDADIRRQAEMAIGLADAVLFVVDAHTGVTDLDQAIATQLRRMGRPTCVVVNKVDKPGDTIVHEFHRLGLGDPMPIAAEGGFGIGDMLDATLAMLPEQAGPEEQPDARVAIVGRPNVGKSSLVNALLGEERVLVEPRAGTTVDAIDAPWRTPHGNFVLVDTAGIRRQAEFEDQAEFYATMRALHALERADVAVLVVDSKEGFQKQEARLAHHALDAGCALLVLYNKWDLVEEREEAWKAVQKDRESRFPTLADLPAHPVSATERIHLAKLPEYIAQRAAENTRRIPTAKLNDWLAEVQRRRAVPSNSEGRAPKIYYVTQTGVRPPTFTFFVNAPSRLNENYRRYLWGHFTEHFGFKGTPLKFRVKKSE
ncbi:MAG: ribosome biogenesis GTPase Der [Candidatus Eisenbacteria bacterium]